MISTRNCWHTISLVFMVVVAFTGGVQAVTWTSASGCWTATDGAYSLMMWNATGVTSWTAPTDVSQVEYLVVAGGAGGGGGSGGGGGAGGLLTATGFSVTAGTSYNVTVGSGGSGGSASGDPALAKGKNGVDSVFSYITSIGGGGGGAAVGDGSAKHGGDGGSGGGSGQNGAVGNGTVGQGSNGGTGTTSPQYGSGGGGGAGTAGGTGTTTSGGVGGTGVQSNIDGNNYWYSGGGGGAIGSGGTRASGGSGVGGDGGGDNGGGAGQDGLSGTNGRGGGGGGASYVDTYHTGGAGGSGVVIIRYLTPVPSTPSNRVGFGADSNQTGVQGSNGFNNGIYSYNGVTESTVGTAYADNFATNTSFRYATALYNTSATVASGDPNVLSGKFTMAANTYTMAIGRLKSYKFGGGVYEFNFDNNNDGGSVTDFNGAVIAESDLDNFYRVAVGNDTAAGTSNISIYKKVAGTLTLINVTDTSTSYIRSNKTWMKIKFDPKNNILDAWVRDDTGSYPTAANVRGVVNSGFNNSYFGFYSMVGTNGPGNLNVDFDDLTINSELVVGFTNIPDTVNGGFIPMYRNAAIGAYWDGTAVVPSTRYTDDFNFNTIDEYTASRAITVLSIDTRKAELKIGENNPATATEFSLSVDNITSDIGTYYFNVRDDYEGNLIHRQGLLFDGANFAGVRRQHNEGRLYLEITGATPLNVGYGETNHYTYYIKIVKTDINTATVYVSINPDFSDAKSLSTTALTPTTGGSPAFYYYSTYSNGAARYAYFSNLQINAIESTSPSGINAGIDSVAHGAMYDTANTASIAGYAPMTVQFKDVGSQYQPINPTLTRNWTYQGIVAGNNTQKAFATVSAPYAEFGEGNWSIKLNNEDIVGTYESPQTFWINVTPLPIVASFVPTNVVGLYPATVAFTDTSTGGPPTAWDWNWGDGTHSYTQHASHTWGAPGTYTVSLNASDAYTYSIASTTVTVYDDIGQQDLWQEGNYPQEFNVYDFGTMVLIPTSTITDNLGNTNTTIAGTGYLFEPAGSYSATISSLGYSNQVYAYAVDSPLSHNIYMNQTAVVNFNGTPTSGYVVSDVAFVDLSTASGITSWAWTFGDGGTSTLQNVTHTYTTAGVYSVSLTITTPDGTYSKTNTNYITMADAPDINSDSTLQFKADTNIIRNMSVYTRTIQADHIQNASFINGTTLFDKDNIQITSVAVNATTYADLALTSYSIDNSTGVIAFNISRTGNFFDSIVTPTSIIDIGMLYDRYKYGVTGAGWGSGVLGNYTYQSTSPVMHLIDSPLTYSWTTFSDFDIANSTPTSGVTIVTFTPLEYTYLADRFLWDFGDGSSFLDYNGTSVDHIYTLVGPVVTYSPSLTAYLSANTSVTNTTTKTVSPVYPTEWVKANFTATKTNVGSAEVVNFIDSSVFGNATAIKIYNWSFGDGTFSSTVGNVNHVYAYYGIYTVALTVSNNNDPALGNSTLTRTDYIQVSADTEGTNLNVLYPREVQFSLVDTFGNSLSGVGVAIAMSNSTIDNTNWLTTLFGVSTDATPLDTTILTGTSDDEGSITFPLIASGKYTMAFNSTSRGISETKTVYPQQLNYVMVLHPDATLIPNRNNYINGTLYVTTPNESYADLRFAYTDLSATTTSISFYVDYSNRTRFNTQTFTGVYNATAYTSVPNVAAASYVFGYFADTTMFGNVSASQGIMMKGVTGKLINLDPCGGYARGWGSQC